MPAVLLSSLMTGDRVLGLVQGKAGTWRGSYILSLPFRLFVDHLGMAGADPEGTDPCAAGSISGDIRVAQRAASPMTLLCAEGISAQLLTFEYQQHQAVGGGRVSLAKRGTSGR